MELNKKCTDYIKLKKRQRELADKVLKLEEEIANSMNLKLEGTTTTETNIFKISVTTKITRKLDYDAFLALGIPEAQSFVELKPQLNLTAFRAYSTFEPEKAASCVTSSPAKTSIKVEVKQ
jgi:hypothetical protein